MDEIAVYRCRIGLFVSIAHKKSQKKKQIPQRQKIKTFKTKKAVPQKTKQNKRKKRHRRQWHYLHNKVFVLLILASFFCFVYKNYMCLEILNSNVKWYPDITLTQSDNYRFTNYLHENNSSGNYRDIVTQSNYTAQLFSTETYAWACGTSEVTADSWLRQRTCYFLLGNKGMHCSNGNPRQDGATGDHGEVALTGRTVRLIQERCNESVGYIKIKNSDYVSYGTGFRVGDCFLITAYHVLDCKIDDIKERIVHTLSIYSDEAFKNLTSSLEISMEKESMEDFDTAVRRVLDKFLDKSATNMSLLLQRLESDINVESMRTEFKSTWKNDCLVDFINHEKFALDWEIAFGEKEYDIVILKLLPTRTGQIFPRAFLLDEKYRQHGNINIMRYIHGDPGKVIIDQDTRVFKDDTELQAATEWAINWWTAEFRDVEESYFREQYSKCCKYIDEDTGRVILRASKSFKPGSSGSPIIYMFNIDTVPVVEMIYQGGYPDFYYEPQMNRKNQFKRLDEITVDCKCFFERATTMKKLAKLLILHGKADLKENLFSQPRCSENTSGIRKMPSDVMLMDLKKWKEDDQICYETKGVKAVVENIVLDQNKYLAVIGVPGSGKSTAIRHAALYLQKRHGYIIYPILHPKEFDEYFDKNYRQVFVMDDPLGEYTVNVGTLNKWVKHGEIIKNCLECSEHTKFLSSTQSQIFNNESLEMATYVFNDRVHCIDLCSEQYLLAVDERRSMLRHYLKDIKLNDSIIWTLSYGADCRAIDNCFPLLCKVYSSDITVRSNPEAFFFNPFQVLTNIFQNMKLKNKHQFCGLVLCSVFENNLHNNILSPWCESNNESDIHLRDDVITSLTLDPKKDLEEINSALKALDGVYISCIGNKYAFPHAIFHDIVNYLQKDPNFIYKFGSIDLILNRVRIDQTLPDDDKYVLIFSGDENMKRLVQRLVKDFLKDSESGARCIAFNCHTDDERFMSYLKEKLLGIKDEAVKEDKINTLFRWCMEAINVKIHNYKENGYGKITGPCIRLAIMLLKCGAKDDACFLSDFSYAVHIAGKTGSAYLLKLMYSNGHDMNKRDTSGNSLLHYVIRYAKCNSIIQLVEQCIESGCLINVLNDNNESLLHYIIQYRHCELRVRLVKIIMKHGCAVNFTNQGKKHISHYYPYTAQSGMLVLQYIAKCCDNSSFLSLSELFINCGCSVKIIDTFGQSILYYLIKNDSDVSVQMAEMFIKHGCCVQITDKYGCNVLHHLCDSVKAKTNKDVQLAEVFIKHGCPVNTIDHKGKNLLQKLCISYINKNTIELATLFITHGCQVKFEKNYGHLLNEVFRKSISHNITCSTEINVRLAVLCIPQLLSLLDELYFRIIFILGERYYDDYDNGIIKLAEVFIKHRCEVDHRDCDVYTLLHLLCDNEIDEHTLELAELFVKHGRQADDINYQKINLLHHLCKPRLSGYSAELAEFFIKIGCRADIIDDKGRNLLHSVFQKGFTGSALKLAKVFIKHGCPVDSIDKDGCTLLHHLCEGNIGEIAVEHAEFLLKHGCPVNIKNKDKNTVLNVIINRLDTTCTSVCTDTEIDIKYKKVLMLVEMFIKHGCPVDNKDQNGNTLLHGLLKCKIDRYTVNLAELFVRQGCPVNSVDSVGRTLLHTFIFNVKDGIKLASMLIEKGCQVSIKDNNNCTVLHYLSRSSLDGSFTQLAETIIHHGCPANVINNEGYSVLHCVIMRHNLTTNDIKLAELFIKHGCSVNVRDERGQTLLHYIARYCDDEYGIQLAKLFLAYDCPINTVDSDGCTELHKVLQNNNKGTVALANFFINHGCSANITNKHGDPVLHQVLKRDSYSKENIVKLSKLFIAKGYPVEFLDKNNRTVLHHIFIKFVREFEMIPQTFTECWPFVEPMYCRAFGDRSECRYIRAPYSDNEYILQLLELFIKNKCPVNAIDKNGYTALDYAFNYYFFSYYPHCKGFYKTAKLFIKNACFTNILCKMVPFYRVLVNLGYEKCEGLVEEIAKQRFSLSIIDMMGCSVLHCLNCNLTNCDSAELAELFIKHGCSVSIVDKNGLSLLNYVIECIQGYDINLAEVFIKHGCPVNVIDKKGRTLLHHLVKHWRDIIVKLADLFIRNGCPVKAKDKKGYTALHRVIQYSRNADGLKLAELLLKHGCSVTDINKKGQSPLHLVSVYGESAVSVSLAEMLIRKSCSIHYKDRSLVFGDTELVKSSIEHECPVDIADGQGCTALHLLVQHCNSENHVGLAELFVKHGCSVNVRDHNGCTVLHRLAKTRNNQHHLHLAEYFVKQGCSVNMKDITGNTPLDLVMQYCHGKHDIRLAELFIKHGNPINITNKDGETVCLSNVDNYGSTVLHRVVEKRVSNVSVYLADLLIRYGCPVDTINDKGETLLHHVIKHCKNKNHIKLAELFINRGCPVNTLDNEGNTLLYHLLKVSDNEYHFALAQVFLDKGCPLNTLHTKNDIVLHLAIDNLAYENYIRLTELFQKTKDCVKKLDEKGNVLSRIVINRCNYENYYTLAKLFLSQECQPQDAHCEGFSTLHLVIECCDKDRHVKLAELYLKQQLPITPKCNDEDSVMLPSNQSGENNLAKLFIEHCFVTSIKQKFGDKVLHRSVKYCENEVDVRVAELFIEHGCSVSTVDDGSTVLHSLILNCEKDVTLKLAELFIKHGCSLNKVDRKGKSLLQSMILNCKNDVGLQLAELFIRHGCSVNIKDDKGNNLLHSLTFNHENSMALELSKLLIRHGCSVNTVNFNYDTLMHSVIENWQSDKGLKLAELFIENGCLAHIERKYYWLHKLDFTNINDYSRQLAELFVKNGCPVDITDGKYKTVLHHLAHHCNNENCVYLAELFIKHGCPLDAIDSDGHNAFHYIRNDGDEHREQLKAVLVKYGL